MVRTNFETGPKIGGRPESKHQVANIDKDKLEADVPLNFNHFIELKDVSYYYSNAKNQVIEDINLSIKHNSTLRLII